MDVTCTILNIKTKHIGESKVVHFNNHATFVLKIKYKYCYSVDATQETSRLGRLINHSKNGNLITRTMEINGIPKLVLIANEDILPGSELSYDYGDRSKMSLRYHPWLAL